MIALRRGGTASALSGWKAATEAAVARVAVQPEMRRHGVRHAAAESIAFLAPAESRDDVRPLPMPGSRGTMTGIHRGELMFEKFSRSWELVKASAGVLRSDKELMLFPLISGAATLVVMATFLIPVFALRIFV